MCRTNNFIFTDFDETLFPKNNDVDRIALLNLEEKIKKSKYVYSWISGSNHEYLLSRSKPYVSCWPDFIASSLGTELSKHLGNGEYEAVAEWSDMLTEDGVDQTSLLRAERILDKSIGDLVIQSIDYQGQFKRSYYFHGEISTQLIDLTNQSLFSLGFRVVATRCSVMAGDPENSFDIDLIPRLSGKGQAVKFIIGLQVGKIGKSYGFGDSENDIEMLNQVDFPFWVGNSRLESNYRIRKTAKKYTDGILEAICGDVL